MSLCDFEQLTPDEWRATCKSWHASREEESRERWEQVRWLGTVSVQPHVRKRLSPRDLLHFPWDDKTREMAATVMRQRRQGEAAWRPAAEPPGTVAGLPGTVAGLPGTVARAAAELAGTVEIKKE